MMADENMVHIMKVEAVRALPWGIMLLVVMLLGGMWIKQEMKEGFEFASRTVVRDVQSAALDPRVFVPLKQNAKEAIQYVTHTAIQEAKDAVLAPRTFVPMKRKVKEAIEYGAVTAADQYERAQRALQKHR